MKKKAIRTGTKKSGLAKSKPAKSKPAKSKPAKSKPAKSGNASALIDGRIRELGDWRGKLLGQIRALIKAADREIVEEWKWRGVPVWSHDGIVCTGEAYKGVVKTTFANGASIDDPAGLFNSSLEGNTRRAIDFHEGEKIDEEALKELIGAAVTFNVAKARAKAKGKSKAAKA